MRPKLQEPHPTPQDTIKRLHEENQDLRIELGKVRRKLTFQRKKLGEGLKDSLTSEMRFTLPYPPSANRYWRTYRGIMVTSPHALQYKATARRIASSVGYEPFTEQVHVQVDVYRPSRRGDLDNTLKVLLDSLNGIAYVDDSQIIDIHARRFEDKHNPRAEVIVQKYFMDSGSSPE